MFFETVDFNKALNNLRLQKEIERELRMAEGLDHYRAEFSLVLEAARIAIAALHDGDIKTATEQLEIIQLKALDN